MKTINVEPCQIQGKRDYQQDDVGFRDIAGGSKLVFLADGMGGYQGGEKASALVVETFSKYPSESNDDSEFLKKLLYQANKNIAEYKEKNPDVSQMGTTLVAMLITETTCQWISVGDSLLYHIRGDQIKRINANHSVAGLLALQLKKGEVTQEEIDNNPNKHMLTSALTGDEISIIDLSQKIKIKPDDIFVLASDGVETISDEDILRNIRSADGDMEVAAKRVLNEVSKKNQPNQDNATIMIVSQRESEVSNNSISKIVGLSKNETSIDIAERTPILLEEESKGFFRPWIIASLSLLVLLGGIFIGINWEKSFFSTNDNNASNLQTSESTLIYKLNNLNNELNIKVMKLGDESLEKKYKAVKVSDCVGTDKKANIKCMNQRMELLENIKKELELKLNIQNKINELAIRSHNLPDANLSKHLFDMNQTLINQSSDFNQTEYDENLTVVDGVLRKQELAKDKKELNSKIDKLKKDSEYKRKTKALEKSQDKSKKEILGQFKSFEKKLEEVNSSKGFNELNAWFDGYLKEIDCTKFAVGEKEKESQENALKKKLPVVTTQ